MTTHYMEEAEQLCDRVAIMDHGKHPRVGHGQRAVSATSRSAPCASQLGPSSTDEPPRARCARVTRVAREVDEFVLYTADVPATIGALRRWRDELGVEGLDMTVRRPTLEDVFLELTGRALRD